MVAGHPCTAAPLIIGELMNDAVSYFRIIHSQPEKFLLPIKLFTSCKTIIFKFYEMQFKRRKE
ncbi:conserved hypothetical protein [Ricinus communis]|uniref:Uncharacterized protein n=1 Tax=Ricinus communis TaxID=3988 RepID=B9T096_RICCO|nr:conserved hypothetical protein [Ricinus communis]